MPSTNKSESTTAERRILSPTFLTYLYNCYVIFAMFFNISERKLQSQVGTNQSAR